MRVTPEADYRELLRDELEFRRRANPSYSLRAFAKKLGVAPSRLSEVLQGKRGLSGASARTIATNLGLSDRERDLFEDLVAAQHARSEAKRAAARERLATAQRDGDWDDDVTLAQLEQIAGWEHSAIMGLLAVEGFEPRPAWIARRLGISPQRAQAALDRLLEVGFLRKRGRALVAGTGPVRSPGGKPSRRLREANAEALDLAKQALFEQPLDAREFGLGYLCVGSEQLPLAKQLIREFRRSFYEALAQPERPDRVYCLSVAFFGLDQPSE